MSGSDRTWIALKSLTMPSSFRDRTVAIGNALLAARALTGAEAASLTLLEGRQPMRYVCTDNAPLVQQPAGRLNEGLARATLLEGRVLVLPAGDLDPRFAAHDVPAGIARATNAISVPVHVRLHNLGVLACFNVPTSGPEPVHAGQMLALVATCLGLTLETTRLARILKRVAVTDDLTQVYNYRFLRTALRREMKRATRARQPFALLMVDVDRLKEYNDRYGHLRGSYLLRDLARVLSRKVRGMDLLAKYGGDEFTVILPETPRAGALAVGERLRAAVAGHSFARGCPGDITVSLGLSVFPDDGIQPATLIAAADVALYAAKHRGRNCVVEATGLMLHDAAA
jgi:diguanylate cyclase (GGDEF)-like protein